MTDHDGWTLFTRKRPREKESIEVFDEIHQKIEQVRVVVHDGRQEFLSDHGSISETAIHKWRHIRGEDGGGE